MFETDDWRKAEKTYIKSKSIGDHEMFLNLRKQTTDLAFKKKRDHFTNKLNQGNSKTMYYVVNKLLDKKQDVVLPTAGSDKELADGFATYFSEQISKLRANLKSPLIKSNLPTPFHHMLHAY